MQEVELKSWFAMQEMSSDRVALIVRHEAVLGRLEEALQENSALQALLLEQANQVGALGAAQEALGRQAEAQKQLQGLQEHSLQSQVDLHLHIFVPLLGLQSLSCAFEVGGEQMCLTVILG